MTTKTNSIKRFTRLKKMEEILDDPLIEEVYGLFLLVKDSPRHIAIKPKDLFNEVLYICSKFYDDNHPEEHLLVYHQEIESDLGWYYASQLVMSIAYVVLGNRKRVPQKIIRLRERIKVMYQNTDYWAMFGEHEYQILKKPSENVKVINLDDLAKMGGRNIIIQVNSADINVNTPGNQIIQQQKNRFNK